MSIKTSKKIQNECFTSAQKAKETLKKNSKLGSKNSKSIISLGLHLLQTFSSSLKKEEFFSLYESVTIACLDFRYFDKALECLEILKKQFPKSGRVALLEGKYWEAHENWKKSTEIYAEILLAEDSPQNLSAQKRNISIQKARGNIFAAIENLSAYLNSYMADFEAWRELAALYLRVYQYNFAAFCFEELILSSPHNFLYYQKYAETLFTIGGLENFHLARKYHSKALLLNENCLAAAFGIYSSSISILSHSSPNQPFSASAAASNNKNNKPKSNQEKDKNLEILAWIQKFLTEKYSKKNTLLLPFLEIMLKN